MPTDHKATAETDYLAKRIEERRNEVRPDRVLLRALMEEYGGEAEDWTALGSLRRVVAALGDAHLIPPKGSTAERWGVRFCGEEQVEDSFPTEAEAWAEVERVRKMIREDEYDPDDYEPIEVVHRWRTTYPVRVTDWSVVLPPAGGGV